LTSLSRYSGTNSVVDTNYTYDNNQRLIKLAHVKGVSTVASYDYSYDAADKLASTVSSVDGTSNYSYDSTNQLTGASHTSQVNEAYSYDANGNRVSGGTVTGVNNQLLSDGVYNYTYDGEGNRTKRTEISTGKVTEYVWDYRNRLASVLFKDAGGIVTKTIDYVYDGNNQRIGKRIDGAVTERYVIDRNQIALVFDGAGVQTHRYLYGTQVDQVLADETLALTNWFLADNQGTVRDVVDSNGTVINHINYDSFGQVQSQSNAGYDLRFGYTGREQDGETGLNYYRARYYDSAVGRFISEDPLGFDAGDSNLSRYVGNSSTNAVDPDGLYGRVTLQTRTIQWRNPPSSKQPNPQVGTLSTVDSKIAGETAFKSQYYRQGPVGGDISEKINTDPTRSYKFRPALIKERSSIISDTTRAEIEYQDEKPTGTTREPWGGNRFREDRGHIIPNILGGSGTDRYNFFPQSKNINRGAYNQFGITLNNKLDKLEFEYRAVKKAIKDGTACPAPDSKLPPKLYMIVDLRYQKPVRNENRKDENPGLRADKLSVSFGFSDGTRGFQEFSNKR
jgi:RHS repeat-associated protein